MGNTASCKVPIYFLLHILCLASSKHIHYFQKQIWDSVHGLFFHGVSSINYNESIGIFQVSYQPSFSSWAWTECVTSVKGLISHYLCNELQNSFSQHSPSKPEWELVLAFTRQGFGIPAAKFPHCKYQNWCAQTPKWRLWRTWAQLQPQRKWEGGSAALWPH